MTVDAVVLGGTFDPVHNGHLQVLEQVLEATGSPLGLLVPAALPNLRGPAEAPPAVRLAMLRAAVEDRPRIEVDDLELRRGGVSYTDDTLRELREAHPGRRHALLLGADAARGIGGWHRARELLRGGAFVVVNRSGERPLDQAELDALGYPAGRTALLAVDSPPISATLVRARVAAGGPLDGLVPPGVAAIIRREHLYSPSERRA